MEKTSTMPTHLHMFALSWCSKSRAFFTAPAAGNYRFYTSVNNYATLQGTWQHQNGTLVTQQLVRQTGVSSIDNYWEKDEQKSPYITLGANQSILLDGSHCCNRNGGHFQVGLFNVSLVGRMVGGVAFSQRLALSQ